MDVIDNGNINSNELNRGGLHLHSRDFGKVALTLLRELKNL